MERTVWSIDRQTSSNAAHAINVFYEVQVNRQEIARKWRSLHFFEHDALAQGPHLEKGDRLVDLVEAMSPITRSLHCSKKRMC